MSDSRPTREHSELFPTQEQWAALAARPGDAPVLMINMLKFKPGGSESYLQYLRKLKAQQESVGATFRYASTAPTLLVGDGERPWWDAILIAEYPTPNSFIDMVSTPEYLEVHENRNAGLERTEVIATSAWPLPS